MKEYYLTIKSNEISVVNKIIKSISSYDCEIHLDNKDSEKSYDFRYNELSNHKLCESVGRSDLDTSRDMNFYNFVSKILEEYGLSKEHKGFKYAIECIRLINTYGLGNYTMEKDIYPAVSSWYNTSICSVEHNIRNAISFSWDNYVNSESENESEMKNFARKPSNSRFLGHISRLTFLAYIGAY